VEKIFYKNNLVAIWIKDIPDGSIPMTDPKEPLQLVTLKHPKGTYLKAHTHKPKKRVTQKLQECLFVKKGEVTVDLYDADKTYFKSISLKPGHSLVLICGGYGIHLIKDSELIEIKNGPFIEDKILI